MMVCFTLLPLITLFLQSCVGTQVVSRYYSNVYLSIDTLPTPSSFLPRRSLLDCLITCQTTHTCQSAFFLHVNGSCVIHTETLDVTQLVTYPDQGQGKLAYLTVTTTTTTSTPATTTPATTTTTTTTTGIPTYNQACSSLCQGTNSQCNNNLCGCQSTYSYDSVQQICTQSCTQYGSTFEAFPNKEMAGYNTYMYSSLDLEQCRLKCLDYTWCRSFDYLEGFMCVIMSTSMLLDQSALINSSFYSHYLRNCA